jgi:DNA-binding GntR family transcriptional regulator
MSKLAERSVDRTAERADASDTAMAAEPVAEPASEVVAHQIRQGIFHGRYAPGQRLVEADLTRLYEVSRGTVRAAFAKLQAEGLVVLTPNRGCAVRRLTRKAIADLMDLRATLDAYGASLAAARIDEGDGALRLKRALKAWKRPELLTDAAVHLQHNATFHELLFELSGNQKLREVLRHMQMPGYRIRFRLLLDGACLARSAADHIAIGSAILAGDRRKAESLARAHTQWASTLLQSLPDSDFDAAR